jgi:hypothetical protein
MKRLQVMHYTGDEYKRITAYLRGKVWVMHVRWVDSCSGCCEIGEYGSGSDRYPTHPKHGCLVGAGCDECGYQGIRVQEFYVPLSKDEQIVLNIRMRIHKALERRNTPCAC